jgi:NAD(P)-dependent dehydrogenase (short-subunit alcohol dehydrogenase family)
VTRLARRVAVVTGASRGIGAATAELLAGEGAQVIRVARSLSAGSHGSFHDVPCDLTDTAQVNRLGVRIVTQHGAPDIVVSNAGSFLLRPLEETDPAEFEQQLAVNLGAPFHVARAFLPAMRKAGKGSFISVGSIADHVGFAENAAYAASKFGLRGLHETLLAEYRGSGVRLTLVSPGPTDTDMWDHVDLEQRPEFTPRSGMLRPNDVAEAILFVATRPPHVLIDWLRLAPT